MGMFGDIVVTDPCDICLVKNLKFQAESPYYEGPDLLSSSIYQSKTASCGITDMPLTTTTGTIYVQVTSQVLTSVLGFHSVLKH